MAADNPAQITLRIDTDTLARIRTTAAALGLTESQLERELLESGLPPRETEAKSRIASRESLPHGVTENAVLKATTELLRTMAKNESIVFRPGELFTSKAKALGRVLAVVWGEDELSAKVRKTLADELLTGLKKVEFHGEPDPTTGDVPPRRVKPYTRRGEG